MASREFRIYIESTSDEYEYDFSVTRHGESIMETTDTMVPGLAKCLESIQETLDVEPMEHI